MNVESHIISKLATATCERISRKVRISLQHMKRNMMQSSEDSGLENVWDEICVQLQHQESVLWDVYDTTVRSMVELEVDRLKPFEKEAIWLQTKQGSDWSIDQEEEPDSIPVINSDIIDHVLCHFLYRDADNWSNKRIRVYLDRCVLD